MALTRKFLSALGIENDKIEEIIEAHSETVNALKEERDKYKEDADKLPDVQKQLEEHSKDETWKVKYDKIKEDFDNYKNEVTTKETRSTKEAALRAALIEAGIPEKRIATITKVTNLEDLKFDDAGKITAETAEALKTEWADFIVKTSEKGAETANPPANNATKTYTSEDIKNMTTEEINANWKAIQASLKNKGD